MDPSMKGSPASSELKRTVGLLALVVVFTVCHASEAMASDKQPESRHNEQRESLKVIETVVNAWNQNDADTIAQQFLPDAVVTLPSGSVLQSRSRIRKRILDERNGRLQDTMLHESVESVSVIGNDRVVVKGRYQLTGMTIFNLFEISPQGSFVLEQVKEQGRWMIARAELSHRDNQ